MHAGHRLEPSPGAAPPESDWYAPGIVARSQPRGSSLCRFSLVWGLAILACQSGSSAPIGSLENPIRAGAFRGEIEYLGRLRCTDGSAPLSQGLSRRYSGAGPLLVEYRVRCIYLNQEVRVFFDGGHPGHVETRAVPGFALSEAAR